jgi:N-acetylmuramoyl-L-alanine amidase
MKIDTIVIHYSATYPDQVITRDTINGWHKQRGFREIGYHWFIRRDGTLEEGRPEGTMGAGVTGHNGANIIHICWAGGLERATGPNKGVWNISPTQEDRLVRLIRDIQKRHPSATHVVGHIDLGTSQCPGLPKGGVAKWWASKNPEPVKTNWLMAFLQTVFKRK